MLRLLLLLALAVGVLLWWKHSQRGRRESDQRERQAAAPAAPEAMLRCAECGLHLPSSQALPGRGGVFCSAEHRQQHEARG